MRYDVVKPFSLICVGMLMVNQCMAEKTNPHSKTSEIPVSQWMQSENDKAKEAEKIRMLEERVQILEYKQKKEKKSQAIAPVLALPQISFRNKYSAAPTYNQDQAMLIMRKNYEQEVRNHDIQPIPMPRIELGGNIIGLGSDNVGPNAPPINGATQTDIQLSGANLYVSSEILQSVIGALRISYNPNPPFRLNDQYILTRVDNSNIYLNTGFVTFGDLNQFPVYLSIGQMFLPFGEYASGLATSILPARLGRFRERPILLGFKQPGTDLGWDFQAFAFRGDTRVGAIVQEKKRGEITTKGGKQFVIDNGGVNLGYKGRSNGINFAAGFSYILNIADSGGMQNAGTSNIVTNGGENIDNNFLDEEDFEAINDSPAPPIIIQNSFVGFGASRNFLQHGVPALDFRGKAGFDRLPISFMGEYVITTRSFAPENLSYNSNYEEISGNLGSPLGLDDLKYLNGARPAAWHFEGSYSFNLWNVPSALTIGGGGSKQVMALNIPASMIGGTLRLNFQKWISLAINYMYSKAYSLNSFGTGELQLAITDKFAGTNQKMLSAQVVARY